MPSSIFLTGDSHFLTPGVLKFRPRYSSVEEHDEMLIANWNKVVKKSDRVYHLGDVGAGHPTALRALLGRLNGQIFLLEGNHDEAAVRPTCRDRFVWIRQSYKLQVGDQKAWLGHFPFLTWSGMWHGQYHCHAHTHNNLKDDDRLRRTDTGVDAWNDTPASWEEIDQKLRARPVPRPDGLGWEAPL